MSIRSVFFKYYLLVLDDKGVAVSEMKNLRLKEVREAVREIKGTSCLFSTDCISRCLNINEAIIKRIINEPNNQRSRMAKIKRQKKAS